MYNKTIKKVGCLALAFAISSVTFLNASLTVCAETDYNAEAEARKSLPVQTNDIENWPDGPAIGAEGAILMEANTGTILYAKNIDQTFFPASTTKIMTCLLGSENIASMDERIPFSQEAVYSIESGSSNAGLDAGEELSFEECLYIMLLYSANEVCNAVAEKVSGSIPSFVDLMNQRALELGCKNTHFNNANGLPDENHYTTPYDLALIAQEFFKNEDLCKISGTGYYEIHPSEKQPDDWAMANHHKMCEGLEYAYDGFVGGKTGYTNVARQTLVSCAERNGMKLICVIMKEESPNQFLDTRDLFDYGFSNFHLENISENETSYTVDNMDFFSTDNDIFGDSKPIISIDSEDNIVLPNTVTFADTTSELSYNQEKDSTTAEIKYSYQGVCVGSASINLTADPNSDYKFDSPASEKKNDDKKESSVKVIFINIVKVILAILGLAILSIGFVIGRAVLKNYYFSRKRRYKQRRKIRRNAKPDFNCYDFEGRKIKIKKPGRRKRKR